MSKRKDELTTRSADNKIVKTRTESSSVISALRTTNKKIHGDVYNVNVNISMRGK